MTRDGFRRLRTIVTGWLTGGLLLAASVTPAAAWTAYYIAEEKTWVIFCKDRTVWGYVGGEEGLEVVGPALCENHGGVAGGGHGRPRILPAPPKLAAVIEGGCTPGPMPGTKRCRAPRELPRTTINEEDKHK